MLVETDNFSYLDFNLIAKILASSELNIHSEVEVFNAAKKWLKHDSEERSKSATRLLQKVRLSLLSEQAVKHLSDKISFFAENSELNNMLNKALVGKKVTQCNYTSRYCNQNSFSILLCGGIYDFDEYDRNVSQINGSNFEDVKDLPPIKTDRVYHVAVCLRGEVFVFSGINNENIFIESVEKYSPSNNTWTVVTNMADKRLNFSACAFIDKIFIFGGYRSNENDDYSATNSCLGFSAKYSSWNEVTSMSVARESSSCVVFQGNIVVSGGEGVNEDSLSTVESFDVFADKWSPMPSMIHGKSYHSLVVVQHKLFVIAQTAYECEVFDNVCKKFVTLKIPLKAPYFTFNKAISIGSRIVIFRNSRSSIICYDVDKKQWSEKPCETTKDLGNFSCTKLPWY